MLGNSDAPPVPARAPSRPPLRHLAARLAPSCSPVTRPVPAAMRQTSVGHIMPGSARHARIPTKSVAPLRSAHAHGPWSCRRRRGPAALLFTARATMASGFMVAWWGVWRAGRPGRWWAVIASWLGSVCCSMMPCRAAAAWCCALARRGSGRPGWRRRPPRSRLRGACRWRGPGPQMRAVRRRMACGGWCLTNPPCGAPMTAGLMPTYGRASSVMPSARCWPMAPIPVAPSGSRCSPRFAGGWCGRLGQAGSCWCLTICSGRMRRRRSCLPMWWASCGGRPSWCSRPTGTRRRPVR
jgi:hypothetical protein